MFCLKFSWGKSTSSEQCPPSIVDMPPTIMDMPYSVLREILKHSDFRSILILRRVCRDFRHFIDDYMPPWNIETIYVAIRHWQIQVRLKEWDAEEIVMCYKYMEDGVSVSLWKNFVRFDPITLETENYVDACIQDFSWILRNQKQKMEKVVLHENELMEKSSCEVPKYYTSWRGIKLERKETDVLATWPFWKRKPNASRIIDSFARVLKSRETPLKTDWLEVSVFDQDQLMKILENVDLESIEIIIVRRANEGAWKSPKFLCFRMF